QALCGRVFFFSTKQRFHINLPEPKFLQESLILFTVQFSPTPSIILPPRGNHSRCFSQIHSLLALVHQPPCPVQAILCFLLSNPSPKPHFTTWVSPLPCQILLLSQANLSLR